MTEVTVARCVDPLTVRVTMAVTVVTELPDPESEPGPADAVCAAGTTITTDVVVLIECAGEGPLEVDPLEVPFCVVLAAGTTLSTDVVVLIVCMDKSPLEASPLEADPPE